MMWFFRCIQMEIINQRKHLQIAIEPCHKFKNIAFILRKTNEKATIDDKRNSRQLRLHSPDVVVGLVMVAVQDGGREAEELHGLALGLVVVEGVEFHGRLHQQLGLLVAMHLAQRQQAAEQQLPPVLL